MRLFIKIIYLFSFKLFTVAYK